MNEATSESTSSSTPTEEELHNPVWQDSNLEKIVSVFILRNEVMVRWKSDLPDCKAKDTALSCLRKLIDERSKRPYAQDVYRINLFATNAENYCAEAKAYVPPSDPVDPAPVDPAPVDPAPADPAPADSETTA